MCWIVFGFVFVAMALIYQKIRREERGSDHYRFSHHSKHLNTAAVISSRPLPSRESSRLTNPLKSFRNVPREALSRRFAGQATLFILAFLLAWIFPMVQFAVTNSPSGTLYYPMLALTVILNPLQGLMNAFIYFRPRYIRARQHMERMKRSRQQRINGSTAQQGEQQQPEESSEQVSSSRSGNRWLADLLRHGKHTPSDGGSGEAAQWQAILSAVSVGGDDDEDDWEKAKAQEVEEDTAETRSCSSTKLVAIDS